MRVLLYSFLFFMSGSLLQCQPTTKPTAADESQSTASPTTTQAQAATPVATSPYPSISEEKMRYLYEKCDYVDYVFFHTNFSMSQNQQGAIRATLSGISTTPAQVFPECKPIGRVFFQEQGQDIGQADLFFGGNCLYYLFLENDQYAYGNQLTQEGVAFYQKIFAQVTTQPGGQ
ncbi:MAG: hypothetical protein R2795_03070 [Saprospiraceae bacterium]